MSHLIVPPYLLALGLVCSAADIGQRGELQPPAHTAPRSGVVRVVGHGLADNQGSFLGLGVSYFTALWRFRHDRQRLEDDLQFLSEQGFNYYRMLSMVGWYAAWEGREIAPVAFTSRTGKLVAQWDDYWRQLGGLIDLAYDRHGMRTQITVFADAQLMPTKAARLEHLQRLLTDVVPGREQKIILIEVANEAWQNGFPGEQGVEDLREFTEYLARRTEIPIATTSNHHEAFERMYANSAADIATWHFSRDRRTDDGWKPVYDCWELAGQPGFPPISSNEPIGPGASVASEQSRIRLVMAAAFAYAAKLPMYVFHSEAGVFGKTRFQDAPAVSDFRHLLTILPQDLPNWRRNDGTGKDAPFIVFAKGKPGRFWPEIPESRNGCVRNVGSRKADRFVCVPIGIRENGLRVQARASMRFEAFNPSTGEVVVTAALGIGEQLVLPAGPGGLIIMGRLIDPPPERSSPEDAPR